MTSSGLSPPIAAPTITVSIVSHGQGNQVAALLDDLGRLQLDLDLIVTVNVPEPKPAVPQSLAALGVSRQHERCGLIVGEALGY